MNEEINSSNNFNNNILEEEESIGSIVTDLIKGQEIQEKYFASYEDIDIHRIMLQDTVRTNAYKNAIYNLKDQFKDKIVMDIGAGTGILSLFCAEAGAKKVLAVEACTKLTQILPKVIEKNGFSNIIEVINSKVENVSLDYKVDIIVSEWMGFYLVHESMLDSVIHARDRFLKEGGLMLPNSAQIYAAPYNVNELWEAQNLFWKSKQYGFDLSPFYDIAKIKTKPEICIVKNEGMLSDPQLLWNFDLNTIKSSELKTLHHRRFFSVEESGDMHAVCLWFTCTFPETDIILSTAPWDEETHWKQTLIFLNDVTNLEEGDIIAWEISMDKCSIDNEDNENEQSKNIQRSYKIQIRFLDVDEEQHPVPCDCGHVKCEIVKHYIEESNNKKSATA